MANAHGTGLLLTFPVSCSLSCMRWKRRSFSEHDDRLPNLAFPKLIDPCDQDLREQIIPIGVLDASEQYQHMRIQSCRSWTVNVSGSFRHQEICSATICFH